MHTGPALPLGELGNCLRPQGEGRPQNFRKEGIVGAKKKKVSDELEISAHSFNQKTKFLINPVKHWF